MNKPIYIHYGSDHFDKQMLIDSVAVSKDNGIGKPTGLWASRVDAEYGWKQWCIGAEFAIDNLKNSFKFILSDEARILEINCMSDIAPYEIKTEFGFKLLDMEALHKQYDGIELYISAVPRWEFNIFSAWDCDSIVVWNTDVIQVIE